MDGYQIAARVTVTKFTGEKLIEKKYMSLLNEKELILSLQNGSVPAFGKIFSEYHKQIYNFCLHLFQSSDDAWESLTRQDMIRFGTFLNPIPGWRGAIPATRLLWPIPQSAINSNPLLIQNPGY